MDSRKKKGPRGKRALFRPPKRKAKKKRSFKQTIQQQFRKRRNTLSGEKEGTLPILDFKKKGDATVQLSCPKNRGYPI